MNPVTALIVLGLLVFYPVVEWWGRSKFEIQRRIPALDRWISRRQAAQCQWFRDHLLLGDNPNDQAVRRRLDYHLYQEACGDCFDYERARCDPDNTHPI